MPDVAAGGPAFSQISLIVADMDAALAFYERLGVKPERTPDGVHASAELSGGLNLEWDTAEFAKLWDSSSAGPGGGGIVLGFAVGSRQAVDDTYAKLTSIGYAGRQVPYDACWGSRYAIVEDPDGYPVGLMSPADDERTSWPPVPAPAS